MKKFYTIVAALLMSISGVMATDVTVIDKSYAATTYGSLSGTTFTTNAASGLAGVTIDGIKGTTATNFAYGACLALTSTNSGTITMTAPEGYKIMGYTLTARSNTYSVSYTLTPSAGGSAVTTSTGGVNLTASGLNAKTASFTYSAGSANSFYIPSLTINIVSDAANLVDVTYELYESDETTLVNSVVKKQEENSAVAVPASFTANTYYDYTTEGTIGTTDCTIKVTRTLKSGVVISLDGLSNSKCYNIRNNRGTWAVGSDATEINSTVELNLAFMASDTKQQFAFIHYDDATDDNNDGYYLYSVSENKFAYIDGNKLSLSALEGGSAAPGKVTFQTSTAASANAEPVIVTVDGNMFGVSTGKSPDVFKYNVAGDGGNSALILEAGDFTATAALAALDAYFHPSYTVTYVVKDGSGNVLFTSEPVGTTNGANITTLPAEYQKSAFYTYNTVNVTISNSGNTNVEFTATPKAEPLVRYTADTSDPYYYNLKIRSKYLVYDDDATGDVTLQDESDAFNADASWAFIGEPYAGFKVINKTKGVDYFLTYTSVVTGGNGGGDGSNNNVQFVASADFNNRYWIIESNTGGFCMRMKENTSIYFHHQKINGSNGYLRTCSISEWSGVHNDEGSTIVAFTDVDVLIGLYDELSALSIGDAIGQYGSSDAQLTSEDVTATIVQVGQVISSGQTSAYADAYAALLQVKACLTLNTPTAGFYRVKNVATDKYLYGTAASTYTSTDKYVFANGDNSSVATVIQLVEKDGHLYMRNQGSEFGWVAQSSTGSGGVGYLRSASFDKYVNWLPGNAAGQIAFAICLGNGAGNYASYLTQGIYAVDTQDNSVVRGSDYTDQTAQWIFEKVTSATVALNAIGSSYYATLCVPFAYTIEGATAYTLTNASESALNMNEVENGAVAAGTPVMLVGSSNAATLTIGSDYANAPQDGTALTGIFLATNVPAANNYFLGRQNGEPGFYKYGGGDNLALKANRAYYAPTTGSTSFGFTLVANDDDVTGIESAINGQSSMVNGQSYYDLTGRKVANPQKGQIYIQNGKKVLF